MAVNVSTVTSVCVYCKANSNSVIEQDFHEIYDDVGLELQLPTLVETYFQIKVKNEGKKYLCDGCVNRLIELYDLQEHAKERESVQTKDSEDHENIVSPIHLDEENARNTEKLACPEQGKCEQQCGFVMENMFHLEDQNSRQYEEEGSFNTTSATILHKEVSIGSESLKSDKGKTIENAKAAAFSLEPIQDDNDINDDFTDEDFTVSDVIEESQELTSLSSNSTIEISNSSAADESQEIFIDDMGNESDLFNTDKSVDFTVQRQTSATEDQLSETENETIINDHDDNDMNSDLYEQLDETLIDDEKTCNQIEENRGMMMANMMHSGDDDNLIKTITKTGEKRAFNEINFITVDSNSVEMDGQGVKNNTKATDDQLNLIEEDYESGDIFEKNHEELSNDSLSLEEEYLIEEIMCSEDHDEIDLNEYLDRVLVTKFQDLELKWEIECKLCMTIYNTFEELLKHPCITELEEEEHQEQFYCIIEKCDQTTENLASLARHLILWHYDKLESVAIYGKCPDCQKTFSNILDFNKHSCCRNIKRKTGSPNYCQYCDMDFQSLKRYIFHMQFHLTNRRPKVCMLCGILFRTSNEFFEHTQYQHIPETAMACIKCDRFFKDKEVFDQHISSHDTKYQYSCTVCPKKYTNKSILAQHMDIYHSNQPNTLKCKHCEKEFVGRLSYRNHMKCHDSDVEVEAFICSTCGIVASSMDHIKYHIEYDENSPCFSSQIEEKVISLAFTCENCSLDYLAINDLKQHRLSANHSDDLFICGICRQSYKTLRHMRNHYSNHKDLDEWKASFPITRYFVCNIGDCQEFYPIWTTLYYHKKRPHKINKSSNGDEFKCQFCQQICCSKMSLAVHVARSHNKSNVKCSHCKRNFKSQKHLQAHVDRYHTPVECDICIKTFKHRRNLESHNNMVHLSIKRYFCKHCGKGYFHKSEKDIHEKKVHPKVSYNCELCNFTTTYPESLQVHMDKHNNQLKFKCTICGKEFGRKQLLQCHLKRHLNRKDDYLKEKGCNCSFLSYNLLKKHIHTKHPDLNFGIKSGDKLSAALRNRAAANAVEEGAGLELWVDDGTTSEMANNNEYLEGDSAELIFEENEVEFAD